jgi:hypothetical protein
MTHTKLVVYPSYYIINIQSALRHLSFRPLRAVADANAAPVPINFGSDNATEALDGERQLRRSPTPTSTGAHSGIHPYFYIPPIGSDVSTHLKARFFLDTPLSAETGERPHHRPI